MRKRLVAATLSLITVGVIHLCLDRGVIESLKGHGLGYIILLNTALCSYGDTKKRSG